LWTIRRWRRYGRPCASLQRSHCLQAGSTPSRPLKRRLRLCCPPPSLVWQAQSKNRFPLRAGCPAPRGSGSPFRRRASAAPVGGGFLRRSRPEPREDFRLAFFRTDDIAQAAELFGKVRLSGDRVENGLNLIFTSNRGTTHPHNAHRHLMICSLVHIWIRTMVN